MLSQFQCNLPELAKVVPSTLYGTDQQTYTMALINKPTLSATYVTITVPLNSVASGTVLCYYHECPCAVFLI